MEGAHVTHLNLNGLAVKPVTTGGLRGMLALWGAHVTHVSAMAINKVRSALPAGLRQRGMHDSCRSPGTHHV